MIVGLCVAHDEADVIGTVVAHTLAEGVDRVIVMDNLSTDGTGDLARDAGAEVIADPVFGHFHGEKITHLARQAHADGATWVLPFDADEIWYSPSGTIAEALNDLVPPERDVVPGVGWDHIVCGVEIAGILGYHHSEPREAYKAQTFPPTFSPWRRQRTQEMPKVAFRAAPNVTVDMGNHDVAPRGHRCPPGLLAYRHFQYRSLGQMTRKLRRGLEVMEATDLHPMHCEHWRQGGLLDDEGMAQKWHDLATEDGLVYDPAPIRVAV